MAYTGRPFGLKAYSWGPYSTWRLPEIDAALLGQSSLSAEASFPLLEDIEAFLAGQSSVGPLRLLQDAVSRVGPLTGRSSLTPDVRLFWEEEPPSDCGNDWVVQGPPPYVCPETVDG
jgi:hypothetical protein